MSTICISMSEIIIIFKSAKMVRVFYLTKSGYIFCTLREFDGEMELLDYRTESYETINQYPIPSMAQIYDMGAVSGDYISKENWKYDLLKWIDVSTEAIVIEIAIPLKYKENIDSFMESIIKMYSEIVMNSIQ